MASQHQAGPSTQGTAARAPPPDSVEGTAYRATVQRCVALVDWWLVRGEDDKIRVAGYAERNRAARLFCSCYITMRHADGTLETADHKILLIRGPLNIPQMHCNGFPYEVSKYFQLGFPVQWERHANPNMNQMNENTQYPSKSTKYYIEKFLHGSFINSAEYNFTEVDSKSSKEPTGNTDGPPTRGLSDLTNGTPSIQEPSCNGGDYDNSVIKVTPSEGSCNGRMGMSDESCEDHLPAETCSGNTDEFPIRGLSSLANGTPRIQEPSGKSGDYHNSMSNTTASEGLCNGRMDMPDESYEDPGPGETCSGQTCQAAKPHELEALAKGLSPAFGLLQCSKGNTGRTLRSGKVCGMSNGASVKKGHSKTKRVQPETLNMKVIPTEETTPPSDPTYQKNGGSVAQIPAEVKLQSQDSSRTGRRRPRKKARRGENI
uniref:Uncharacterized protein n=2 Tax=Avena sativa TaxID=4498 RepID=A0ACD5UAI1_AVESA